MNTLNTVCLFIQLNPFFSDHTLFGLLDRHPEHSCCSPSSSIEIHRGWRQSAQPPPQYRWRGKVKAVALLCLWAVNSTVMLANAKHHLRHFKTIAILTHTQHFFLCVCNETNIWLRRNSCLNILSLLHITVCFYIISFLFFFLLLAMEHKKMKAKLAASTSTRNTLTL